MTGVNLNSVAAFFRRLSGRERVCVYTCLIGKYESLNEQPIARNSKIPFLCLTDDPDLRSETWQIVRVEPLFPMDLIRSQRMLKILPHRFLPDFDVSLYIDNSVVLSRPPEEILDRHFGGTDFALPTNSIRERVVDAFLEVARLRFDDSTRIFEQLNHFALLYPDILLQRPYWSGVLMRRHRAEQVVRALEIWAAHVLRYSRRDQLSANIAFSVCGLQPRRIEMDILHSWFHDWPRVERRDRNAGARRPGMALTPVLARLETLDGPHKALFEQIVSAQRKSWQGPVADQTAPVRPDAPATFVKCANGRLIYVDPTDDRSPGLVEKGGDFHPLTTAMWRLLLAECEWTHILDIGANYGEMLVGVDFPSTATVIAVEPNPHVLPYLRRTIEEAGLDVAIVAMAASAQVGTSELLIDRTWSGVSTLGRRLPSEAADHVVEIIEVPTTTVDALVGAPASGKPPHVLVKIDVEGHEVAVLAGAAKAINGAGRFAALIEIHHASDQDLDRLLADFAIELYDTKAAALVPVSATNAAALHGEIAARSLYRLDAVVRPR